MKEHAAFLHKDFPALPPEWIPEVGAAVVGGWVAIYGPICDL